MAARVLPDMRPYLTAMRPAASLLFLLSLAVCLPACGDDDGPAGPSDAGPSFPTPAEGPPANPAEFAAWLAGGEYLTWNCEPDPHPARAPSPHGMNRICQNSIADAAFETTGAYPPGAAWVKEQYSGGVIFAIEISRRENNGTGPTAWRFWRGQGPGYAAVTQNAVAQPFCAGCHTMGDRDFVFSGFAPGATGP